MTYICKSIIARPKQANIVVLLSARCHRLESQSKGAESKCKCNQPLKCRPSCVNLIKLKYLLSNALKHYANPFAPSKQLIQ